MNTDIKEISERLKGMRDALGLMPSEIARDCGIGESDYLGYERGEKEIPVTFLIRFASMYRIELTTLLTGESPRMHSYSLTRKGQGTRVERRKEYQYRALNEGFIHKKASPFIVSVDPSDVECQVPLYHHEGQEFNMILEGKLMIVINGKELILEQGDSLWFDSGLPHGMKALGGNPAIFLAIVF
jgi:mannose-6-phosphate isomerase-like protein (cupin superfamily)